MTDTNVIDTATPHHTNDDVDKSKEEINKKLPEYKADGEITYVKLSYQPDTSSKYKLPATKIIGKDSTKGTIITESTESPNVGEIIFTSSISVVTRKRNIAERPFENIAQYYNISSLINETLMELDECDESDEIENCL